MVSKYAPRNATLLVALLLSFFIPSAQAAYSGEINKSPSLSNALAQNSAAVEKVDPFEFHSGFWINLHHFLYEQALLRRKQGTSAPTTTQLTPDQEQLWNAALDYYIKSMIKRDFVTDQGMIETNDKLAENEMAPDLTKSGIDVELAKTIESVAPIYGAKWWPQHDRANRFWISVAIPMVKLLGPTLIEQLTVAYKAKWPSGPVRVDVVEYANWAGAYTTLGRQVHVTIATDPANQGFVALELLFHEASHSMVGPRYGPVPRAIANESRKRNKPIPDGLWHAIIFYTSGEFTKRNLREHGVTDYVPIGYRGLYERAWPRLQRPLELHWQPYLDGKVDFETAMSNLVEAVTSDDQN